MSKSEALFGAGLIALTIIALVALWLLSGATWGPHR